MNEDAALCVGERGACQYFLNFGWQITWTQILGGHHTYNGNYRRANISEPILTHRKCSGPVARQTTRWPSINMTPVAGSLD